MSLSAGELVRREYQPCPAGAGGLAGCGSCSLSGSPLVRTTMSTRRWTMPCPLPWCDQAAASWTPKDCGECEARQPCAPCRGYSDYCAPLGCSEAVLDELLWALFGWLWVLGGQPLDSWTHELAWQCVGCGGWQSPDHGCADQDPDLCDDCWAAHYWDPADGREDYP